MPVEGGEVDLLRRVAASRDAEAVAELVRRYQGLVHGTCLRVLENAADAEDAAQECFLRLVRNAGVVTSSLGGWLHRTAVRVAIDTRRRKAARGAREEIYCQMKRTDGAATNWQGVALLVDEALEELPDELCHLLTERFLRGRTQAELAEELGLSPATVSRRVQAGIESLREKLKRAGVPITGATLAVLLSDNAAVAVPASVTASLGKIAIAGGGAAPGAALTAGAGAVALGLKYAVAALVMVLAIGGIVAVTRIGRDQPPPPPQQAAPRSPARATGGKEQPPAKPPPQPAAAPTHWVATLPNGAVIELLGIARHPSDGKWWKPDGSPLLQAPYDKSSIEGSAPSRLVLRELAVRFTKVPPGDVAHAFRIVPPMPHRDQLARVLAQQVIRAGGPAVKGRRYTTEVRSYVQAFPKTLRTATLRFGIASGPWTVMMTCDPAAPSAKPAALLDWMKPATAFEVNGRARVTFRHPVPWLYWDRRVVAVEKTGKLHVRKGFSGTHGLGGARGTSRFGVPLASVKEFRVELRPYQWAEFHNVVLQPGQKAKAEVRLTADKSPKSLLTEGKGGGNGQAEQRGGEGNH